MLEQLRDVVERPGFGDLHFLEQARHCLAQSPAKQWVVARNNQTRRIAHTLHLRLRESRSWAVYGRYLTSIPQFQHRGPALPRLPRHTAIFTFGLIIQQPDEG